MNTLNYNVKEQLDSYRSPLWIDPATNAASTAASGPERFNTPEYNRALALAEMSIRNSGNTRSIEMFSEVTGRAKDALGATAAEASNTTLVPHGATEIGRSLVEHSTVIDESEVVKDELDDISAQDAAEQAANGTGEDPELLMATGQE